MKEEILSVVSDVTAVSKSVFRSRPCRLRLLGEDGGGDWVKAAGGGAVGCNNWM